MLGITGWWHVVSIRKGSVIPKPFPCHGIMIKYNNACTIGTSPSMQYVYVHFIEKHQLQWHRPISMKIQCFTIGQWHIAPNNCLFITKVTGIHVCWSVIMGDLSPSHKGVYWTRPEAFRTGPPSCTVHSLNHKSDGRCRNTLSCINRYTAPNSKYTGSEFYLKSSVYKRIIHIVEMH